MNYTNNPYLHESSQGLKRLKHKQSAFSETMCKSGVTTRDKNEVINSGSFTDTSEAAALSFKGGSFHKWLGSDRFANFLEYADAHNQTANALVALITAGMVRPTLTMAIPGMKDKRDKIYSAGQAVSSGFLGFGVTMALTKPLDDALKKVKDNPEKYNCTFLANMNKKIKQLEEASKGATGKELKSLEKQKKTLDLLVKNIPEWAICVPRAMLTIALIPLILKYVFGLTKTPKNKPAEAQQAEFNNLQAGKDINKFLDNNQNNAKKLNFNGKIPEAAVETVVNAGKNKNAGGFYDKFTDFIANKFTSPVINSKKLQNISDKWKDSEFLFNHVSTVTSMVISGVYMQRTLANKNLEDDKKKVLAVNQGLTFAISTTLSYLIDAKLNSWWERVTAKMIGARADEKDFAKDFAIAQKERAGQIKANKNLKPLKALDYAKDKKLVLPTNIDKLVNGMGLLKKMAIIGIIFRLAVPIAATPLASWVEELRQKHMAKQS